MTFTIKYCKPLVVKIELNEVVTIRDKLKSLLCYIIY